jgi:hypothetical protein
VSPRTLQTVLVKLITNHNANGFLLSSSIRWDRFILQLFISSALVHLIRTLPFYFLI